jgi:hypothetical protein
MTRLLTITLTTLAAAAILTACSSDCPACSEVRNPPTARAYAFTLCISEVPTFAGPNDPGCGDVAVSYTRER